MIENGFQCRDLPASSFEKGTTAAFMYNTDTCMIDSVYPQKRISNIAINGGTRTG